MQAAVTLNSDIFDACFISERLVVDTNSGVNSNQAFALCEYWPVLSQVNVHMFVKRPREIVNWFKYFIVIIIKSISVVLWLSVKLLQ